MKRPLLAFITIAYALAVAPSVLVGLTGGAHSRFAFDAGVGAMFVPAIAMLVVLLTTRAEPPSLGWSRFPSTPSGSSGTAGLAGSRATC